MNQAECQRRATEVLGRECLCKNRGGRHYILVREMSSTQARGFGSSWEEALHNCMNLELVRFIEANGLYVPDSEPAVFLFNLLLTDREEFKRKYKRQTVVMGDTFKPKAA